MKSTVDEIRQRFDADVERFSNLEDVPRNGPNILSDPCRGRSRRLRQRGPKNTGCAREHEGADAGQRGFLQEIERTGSIRVTM
jgi:hypothetical protein